MTNQPIPVVTEAGHYSFYAENLYQCIKRTNQLSGTLYHNICDGTSFFVPAGFWDYAFGFGCLAIGVMLFLTLLGLFFE